MPPPLCAKLCHSAIIALFDFLSIADRLKTMKANTLFSVIGALLATLPISTVNAAPLTVMTIGDSMTEEYRFEFPFSAPDSMPVIANTMNWVEILAARRASDISFGSYEEELLSYPDYRDAGYEYNWGIPGFTSSQWQEIVTASVTDFFAFYNRTQMFPQYSQVDVVVIMIGGNDLRSQYGTLYDPEPGDPTTEQIIATIIANLNDVIDEIRRASSSVPIVLADVPDLGAAPDKISSHPDPVKRSQASVKVAALNQAIAELAVQRGVTPAAISQLTDRILSPEPAFIGAIEMIKDVDPTRENRPRYLFCKEGLHPSTNGQALIAKTLLDAINTATSSNISPLTEREILSELLGLNPDQPFLDWATAHSLTDLNMTADEDGDGIPHLGEYLLDLNPTVANAEFAPYLTTTNGNKKFQWDFQLNSIAERLA
ncbi:MAG: SGNH/GDSL hydrolase family protein, partial [Akkermansiaceae bacterium]